MYSPQQQALLDLQKIDLDVLTLQRAYAQHPAHKKSQEIEAVVAKIGASLESLEEQEHDLDKKITAGHDDIETAKGKIEQDQLEMTRVSDPRTVQVLNKDLEALNRRIDKIEFDEVGLLDALESLQNNITNLRDKREKLTAALEKNKAGLASLKAQVEEKLGTLQTKKEAALAQLSPERVSQYNALLVEKKGVAVGEFINETCNVCRVKLATTQIDEILDHSGDVCICPSCKRLIVVP